MTPRALHCTHSGAELELAVRRQPLFSFVSRPYLLAYAGFLTIMASLSFAIESVSAAANAIRWPVLGVMATLGLGAMALRRFGRWTPSHLALATFLGCMFVSTSWSLDPTYTFLRSVSVALLFSATFVGLYAYCRSPAQAVAFTDLLWFLGTLLVVGGLVYSRGGLGQQERYEGLYSRATGAGAYSALLLPLAVFQVRYRFRGLMRTIGWGVVALLFGQLVLSGARMALVTGSLISLLLWFDFYGRRAAIALVGFVLLLPVPFLMNRHQTESLQKRSESILRKESWGTLTGRLGRWTFGLQKFFDRPVAGHGFGVSRLLAAIEHPSRFKAKGREFYLHSDQIEVLVDLGVVGYLPFAAFWLYLAGLTARLVLARRDARRQLSLAYLGAGFYVFGDTFMHGGFLSAGAGTSSWTWSILAVFLALQHQAVRRPRSTLKRPETRTRRPLTRRQPEPPRAAESSRRRELVAAGLPRVDDILAGARR